MSRHKHHRHHRNQEYQGQGSWLDQPERDLKNIARQLEQMNRDLEEIRLQRAQRTRVGGIVTSGNCMVVTNQGVFVNGQRVDNPEDYGVVIYNPVQNSYGSNPPQQAQQSRQQDRFLGLQGSLDASGAPRFPDWESRIYRRATPSCRTDGPFDYELGKINEYELQRLISLGEARTLREMVFKVRGEFEQRGKESASFKAKNSHPDLQSGLERLMKVLDENSTNDDTMSNVRKNAELLIQTGRAYSLSTDDIVALVQSLTSAADYSHYTDSIREAVLTLAPFVGRAGGIDKVCRIPIELSRLGDVKAGVKDYANQTVSIIQSSGFQTDNVPLIQEVYQKSPSKMSIGQIASQVKTVRAVSGRATQPQSEVLDLVSSLSRYLDGDCVDVNNLSNELIGIGRSFGVTSKDLALIVSTFCEVSCYDLYSRSSIRNAVRDLLPYAQRLGTQRVCSIGRDLIGMSGYAEEISSVVKSTRRIIDDARSHSQTPEDRLSVLHQYNAKTLFSHSTTELRAKARKIIDRGKSIDKIVSKEYSAGELTYHSPYPTQPQDNPWGVLGGVVSAISSLFGGGGSSGGGGGWGGGSGGSSSETQESPAQSGRDPNTPIHGDPYSGYRGYVQSDGTVEVYGDSGYIGSADVPKGASDSDIAGTVSDVGVNSQSD